MTIVGKAIIALDHGECRSTWEVNDGELAIAQTRQSNNASFMYPYIYHTVQSRDAAYSDLNSKRFSYWLFRLRACDIAIVAVTLESKRPKSVIVFLPE